MGDRCRAAPNFVGVTEEESIFYHVGGRCWLAPMATKIVNAHETTLENTS
jgi:hypothetical protein